MAMLTELTETNFAREVLAAEAPVVVLFHRPASGACRFALARLQQLAEEFAGRLRIAQVDCGREPALTRRCGVEILPALLSYRDGGAIAHVDDVRGTREIRTWLSRQAFLKLRKESDGA